LISIEIIDDAMASGLSFFRKNTNNLTFDFINTQII
jgi:hypothetical protein